MFLLIPMAKKLAIVFGWIFLIIGVVGFFWDPLLGVFDVGTWHNIVHVVTGILGIWAASSGETASKTYLKIFGVIYAIVTIWGLFSANTLFGLMYVNSADTVLHLIVALIFLYGGYSSSTMPGMPSAPRTNP